MKKYTLKNEWTGQEISITATSYESKNYEHTFPVIVVNAGDSVGDLRYTSKNWRICWIENVDCDNDLTINTDGKRD